MLVMLVTCEMVNLISPFPNPPLPPSLFLQKTERGGLTAIKDRFCGKNIEYLVILRIFNIYHVLGSFVKIPGCRFLYFFSLCEVGGQSSLSDSRTFQLQRSETEKTQEIKKKLVHE